MSTKDFPKSQSKMYWCIDILQKISSFKNNWCRWKLFLIAMPTQHVAGKYQVYLYLYISCHYLPDS